jgi:hypothetical protein
MGTIEGGIFLFDPIMRGNLEVKRFNSEVDPYVNKNRSVDLIKWIEPSENKKRS